MEQLGRKKAQSKTLKRILGAENTLFDLKKKRKKATCKRFKQKFRGNKCPFKLKQQKVLKELNDDKIKSIKIISKLEKETKDDMIKNIRNLFKSKNETKLIKDKIISDIRNVFEQEEDSKALRIGKFCSNNYIKIWK